MIKVHYDDDQPEMLRICDGRMYEFVEDFNALTKSAASQLFDAAMLDSVRPDDYHFLIHNIGMGDQETYGCYFAGAPVKTPSGGRAVESISKGDLVLTHSGNYRPVLRTFTDWYEGDAVFLDIAGLPEEIPSTSNHPYFVLPKALFTPDKIRARNLERQELSLFDYLREVQNSGDYRAAEDITVGDYVRVPYPKGQARNIMTPAYLAGAYLAEGCGLKEYRAGLATQGELKGFILVGNNASDEEAWKARDAALALCYRHIPSRQDTPNTELGVRYPVYWKEAAQELAELCGLLSTNKHIHADIFAQTEDWILDFLAGYLDGDGCRSEKKDPKKNGVLAFSTASRDLALSLQLLFGKVGMPVSVSKGYNRNEQGCFGNSDHVIWECSIGASYSNKVLSHCKRLQPHTKELLNRGQATTKMAPDFLLLRVNGLRLQPVSCQKFNLEVAEDNTYVVDIQGHNSNKNGDGWPKEACESRCHTFVSEGAFFREHRNRSKKEAIGSIKLAGFHPEMQRIETVLWGDKRKAEEEYELAKAGKALSFSMSARVPYDICTCCGNRAKKASLYCSHLKHHMNQWMPEFRKYAYAINDKPTFYDMSKVATPADRIARYLEYRFADDELRKAASANLIITGSDWAEFEGVCVPDPEEPMSFPILKHAMLSKLAQEEDWLTDASDAQAGSLKSAFAKDVAPHALARELSEDELQAIREIRPATLMYEMAKRAAVLPFISFAAYATGQSIAETRESLVAKRAAARHIPGIFNKLLAAGDEPQLSEMFEAQGKYLSDCDAAKTAAVDDILDGIGAGASIDPDAVRYRVLAHEVSKPHMDMESVKSASSLDGDASLLARAYGHYQLSALCDMESVRGEDISDAQKTLIVGANRNIYH